MKFKSKLWLALGFSVATIALSSITIAYQKSDIITQKYFDSKMLLKITFDESKIINDITKKEYKATNGKYEEGTKILGFNPENNYIKITDINLSKEDSITVSFSFKFDSDGISDTTKEERVILPILLNDGKYNLKVTNKKIGFTTNNTDLFGKEYNFEPNKWYNIIATFNKNDISKNKIFVNGVKNNLYQINGTPTRENLNFEGENIYISGNETNLNYTLKDNDIIDEIYLLKDSINDSQANYLYLYSRIPEFRIDNLDLSNPTIPKVNLSWGLDILDTDLLAAKFYDSSSEQSFHWGGKGVGKQELATEEVYQGKSSYKVTDTVTKREGNHFNYPNTTSTTSIHTFSRLYDIPSNEYVSMSIKLKSNKSGSYYRLNGDGGWEIGREFDLYKAKLTKDAPKGSNVIYLDDINEFKRQASPNNNLPSAGYYITSDKDKDVLKDGTIQIREIYTLEEYEKKVKNNEINIDNIASEELPIGTITEFDYEKIRIDTKSTPIPGVIILSSSIKTDIKSGENLKARKWHGALSFSSNTAIADNNWHVYNSNTYTKYNQYYDLQTRGMSLYANASTSGVLYADSLKFGYATKAIVRRDGNLIYEGYDAKFVDNNAKDSSKPNTVNKDTIIANVNFKNTKQPTNDRVMSIIFDEVEDVGTKYNYTIQSVSRSGNQSPESNPILVDVKTDIKGYSYIIDKNKTTKVDSNIDTIKVQGDNKNLIEHNITESGLYYLHIAAIDNAGNISETLHFPISVPELEAKVNHKENYIDLKWSMEDNNEPFQFKVFKKIIDEEIYQSGSMMNFEDDTKVNVLNIHPNVGENITFTTWDGETLTLPKSANLKQWMEEPNKENSKGYGKGIIEVTPITQTQFNENPELYLKNEDGSWKYDVIYLGHWDTNYNQIPSDKAVELYEEFINDGRGFLAGHDTIGWNVGTNRGLGKIRNLFNVKVGYWNDASLGIDEGHNYYGGFISTKINVKKAGLLTNYPWTIGSIDTELTIPLSHSTSNFAYGDIWMTFSGGGLWNGTNIPEYLYPYSNYYLTTWNNTAMIQTGHSNGAATPDEQKLLANTLFYLKQLSSSEEVKDNSAQDLTAPPKPTTKEYKFRDGYMIVDLILNKTEDIGTKYNHYIEAEGITKKQIRVSNITTTEIKSGFKGYSYVVDTNPNTIPDDKVETSKEKITVKVPDSKDFYIHIKAIDNVGNASETLHFKITRHQDFVIDGYNIEDENNKNVSDVEHGKKYNVNLKISNSEVSNSFLSNLVSAIKDKINNSFLDISLKDILTYEITDEDLENGKYTTEIITDTMYLDYYDKFKSILRISDNREEQIVLDEIEWKVYSGTNIFKKSHLIKEGTLNNILSDDKNYIEFELKDIPKNHDKISIVAKYNKIDKNILNNKIEVVYDILNETNDTLVDKTKKIDSSNKKIDNPTFKAPAQGSKFGTSYYKSSNIREWLNSNNTLVEYTMPAPTKDIHGSYAYDDEAGFLTNFTEEEQNAIAITKRKSFTNTTLTELKDGGSIYDFSSENIAFESTPAGFSNIVNNWNNYNYSLLYDKMFLLNSVEYYNYMERRGFEEQKQLMENAKKKHNYSSNSISWYLGEARLEEGSTQADKIIYVDSYNNNTIDWDILNKKFGIVPAFHIKPDYIFDNNIKAKDLKIGDIVNFGKYNNETIQWKVINITDNKYPLLLSEKIIDIKPYNTKSDITYRESNIINFKNFDVDISTDMKYTSLKNNDSTNPKISILNHDEVALQRKEKGYYINIKATDESGINYIILPNGKKMYQSEVNYYVSGNGYYTFTACDNNGNFKQLTVPVGNIQSESHAIVSPSSTKWTNQDVTVDIFASNDVSYSLKNDIQNIRDDNFGYWSNYINYKGKRLRFKGIIDFESADKEYTDSLDAGPGIINRYLQKDSDGEYRLKKTWLYAKRWKLKELEKNGPVEFDIEFTVPENYYDNMTIFTQMNVHREERGYAIRWESLDVELIDNDDFGIEKIVLPNKQEIPSSKYTDTLTKEGTYTYTIYDNRGTRIDRDVTVKIDKVNPTLKIEGNPIDWTNQEVILNLTATDNRSGIEKIVLPNGEEILTNKEELTELKTTYNIYQNGEYKFEIYDVAGNMSTTTISVTKLDTKSPTLGATINPEEWTSGDVQINVKAIDTDSGIKHIKLPNQTYVNADNTSYTVSKNGEYKFIAEDKTGLEAELIVPVSNIDKEKPFMKDFKIDGDYKSSTIQLIADDLDSGIKRVKLPNGKYIENTNENLKEIKVSYTSSKESYCTFELEDRVGHITIVKVAIEGIDSRAVSPIITEEIQSGVYDPVLDTLYLDNNDTFSGYARADIPAGYIDHTIDKIKWEAFTGTEDNLKGNKVGSGEGENIKVENEIDGGQAHLPFTLYLKDIPKNHNKLTFITIVEDENDDNLDNNILEITYNIDFALNDIDSGGWVPPSPTHFDEILDKLEYTVTATNGKDKSKLISEGKMQNIKVPISKNSWVDIPFDVSKDKDMVDIIIKVNIQDLSDSVVDNNETIIKIPIIKNATENDIGIENVTIYPVGNNNTTDTNDDCYATLGTPISIKANVVSTNIKTQDATAILKLNNEVIKEKRVYGISADMPSSVYFNYTLDEFTNKNSNSETLKFDIEIIPDIKEDAENNSNNISKPIYVTVKNRESAKTQDNYTNSSKSAQFEVNQDIVVYSKVMKNDKTKLIKEPCGKACQTDSSGNTFCPGHSIYTWEDSWYTAYIPVDSYNLGQIEEEVNITSIKFRSKFTKSSISKHTSLIDNEGKLTILDSQGNIKNDAKELIKVKAGYGFEIDLETEYKNNLPEKFNSYSKNNTVINESLKEKDWTRYKQFDNNSIFIISDTDKELKKHSQGVMFSVPSVEDIGIEFSNDVYIKTPSTGDKEYLSIGKGIKINDKKSPYSIGSKYYTHKKAYTLGSEDNSINKYYVSQNTKNGMYLIRLFTPRTGIGACCDNGSKKVKDRVELNINVYGGYLDDLKTHLNE